MRSDPGGKPSRTFDAAHRRVGGVAIVLVGGVTTVAAVGTFAGVLSTGVPGLPGVFMPAWLVVAGIWLAVGRSRVTRAENAR
ncbi:hypothetical protein [Microbacterium sp. NPDC055357]